MIINIMITFGTNKKHIFIFVPSYNKLCVSNMHCSILCEILYHEARRSIIYDNILLYLSTYKLSSAKSPQNCKLLVLKGIFCVGAHLKFCQRNIC